MSDNSFVVSSRNCGKSLVKQLRSSGLVPCTLHDGKECIHYAISEKILIKTLMERGFFATVFALVDSNGKKICDALPREAQYHPISGKPLHINFMKIDDNSKFILQVPLIFKNADKAPGLKQGGSLKFRKNTLKLRVKDRNSIISGIEVDLKNMNLLDFINVRDIKIPSGAVLVSSDEFQKIVYMKAPRREG